MATIVNIPLTRYDFPQLINMLGIKRGIEVGTYHGAFSYYLLKHSSLNELWSVDSFNGKYEFAELDAIALLSEFGDRSKLLHMDSMTASKQANATGNTFGFIYIDADHRRSAINHDVGAWLKQLRKPGILAGHDYVEDRLHGVVPVVNALADKLDMPVYVTRERWASWFIIFGG